MKKKSENGNVKVIWDEEKISLLEKEKEKLRKSGRKIEDLQKTPMPPSKSINKAFIDEGDSS